MTTNLGNFELKGLTFNISSQNMSPVEVQCFLKTLLKVVIETLNILIS